MLQVAPQERKLNSEQKEAVEFGEGPLLIIAGAGTGKTTVVTERIKYLITSGKAKASEILALTFTEKAAREMEERVDVLMPYGYTQMWISTFHSFCDRVLRQEAIHIGLNPAYKLLSDTDVTLLIRKHLFEFDLDYFRPLGNPTKFISGMITHFSRLRDEDVTPTQYSTWMKSQKENNPTPPPLNLRGGAGGVINDEELLEIKKYEELTKAYEFYENLKVKEGFMDFSNLIGNTLELFRTRKNILRTYQNQFKYILIDEFQDTNIAQNELVLLLAGQKKNITVVADDDQSVYRFRGAAVSNVLFFRKHFPEAKMIVLSKNYRSTQEILDKSYQLIQHNNPDRLEVKEGVNKKLTSTRELKGNAIVFMHVDRVENEADIVAKEIKKLVSSIKYQVSTDEAYRWKDFAILIRANNHAEPFTRALLRHGIPFQFLGPGQLFRQPEIKELTAYLQVLSNFEDNVSFYKLLTMSFFELSARDLAVLTNFSKKYNVSLFETSELALGLSPNAHDQRPNISEVTRDKLRQIVSMIHRHLKLIPKETAGQILYFFLEDTGMLKKILNYEVPLDERKATNITKFFGKLKTYEVEHEDASVQTVLDWLMLSMELGESPLATDTDWTDNDAVNILTVHSAKGLEFKVVFLVNLVAQRFPTTERREQIPIPESLIKEELPVGDYHEEEERRLFYVGMTRARDLLYFTAANYYGEGKREKKISPFVYEALGDEVISHRVVPHEHQLSLLEWKKEAEVPDTKKFLKPITYLSYSQIETFRLCPLHYKLRYILNVPPPPSPALSFGNTMHTTLKEFYQRIKQGEQGSVALLHKLLHKNWIREGYTSKKYEEEMHRRGKKYLKEFFEKGFEPEIKTLLLEQSFTVPIQTPHGSLKIGGRIDRIDELSDDTIEIIDYKTGRLPSQREIDVSLQLSMYALAATEVREPPFNRKAEDIVLSMYFFDNQEKMTTTRTRKHLEKEKEKIIEIAQEIENSDFRCSGNQLCVSCEYKMFCGIEGTV